MKYFNLFLQFLDYIFHFGLKSFSVFTHLTKSEKIILYSLAKRESKDFASVEIGSYLGASANFLAAGIIRSNRPKNLYCVDTWQNDAMTEGKKDTWNAFLQNTEKFKGIIQPLKGVSYEVGKLYTKDISLLFIDGDHNYEGCYKDVVAWFPHVVIGGRIIFHDIGWAEGVQKVVAQLKEKDAIEGLVISNNICWATKKKDIQFE